eukprot:1353482-Amphidinium_carterae.1
MSSSAQGKTVPDEASKVIEDELAKLSTLEQSSSEYNVCRSLKYLSHHQKDYLASTSSTLDQPVVLLIFALPCCNFNGLNYSPTFWYNAAFVSVARSHRANDHDYRNYLEWLTCLPWGQFTEENQDIAKAERILNEDCSN